MAITNKYDNMTSNDSLSNADLYPPPPEKAKQALKKSFWSGSWGNLLFCLALGAALGWLGIPSKIQLWLHETGFPEVKILSAAFLALALFALACFFFSAWINILLHETGHVLAGMARGMRLLCVGVGRLRYERTVTGWRFYRVEKNKGCIGGFALMASGSNDALLKKNMLIFVLGGVLMNTATGFCSLWAAMQLNGYGKMPLLFIAFFAFLAVAFNLWPRCWHGWRSDGRIFLDILRETPNGLLHLQIQQLTALRMTGIRPRDWPEKLLPPKDFSPDTLPMMRVSCLMFAMTYAEDRGDLELMRECVSQLVPQYWAMPEGVRETIAVNLAEYAVKVGDEALLGAWLPLCRGGMLDLSYILAPLEAQHALLQGHYDEARQRSKLARTLIGRAKFPDEAIIIKEELDALDEELGAADAARHTIDRGFA